MATRQKLITAATEQQILLKSKRRCPICFESGNVEPQRGVIAQIDKSSSQPDEADNLVFLCLTHHAALDRRDGINPTEMKNARDALYDSLSKAESQPVVLGVEAMEYEKQVTDFVRAQFAERLGDFFALHRNPLYRGRSGVSYEVDLATEFTLSGLRYLTIFEIKNRRAPVGVQDILEFAAKANDIRADKAVFVCKNGFSASAIKLALDQGIGLIDTDRETELFKAITGDGRA